MPNNPHELAAALRSTVTKLTRQLRKQNISSDFSNAEIRAMALLDQHGRLLPSELAEMERVSAQAISQIINRLSEAKCVEKVMSDTDKRKVLIYLTKKGTQHLAATRRLKEEWLVKAMADLYTPQELALIDAFLPLLKRLTEYNG